MIPTYISTPSPVISKPLYVVIFEYCRQTETPPIFCELSDDFGKNKSHLPQSLTSNSITYSGTASGVSTSTIQLGMQYEVKAEK